MEIFNMGRENKGIEYKIRNKIISDDLCEE